MFRRLPDALLVPAAEVAVSIDGRPFTARAGDTVAAALLVIAGAFALLYVFIVGGQAWPLDIFPGYATSSTFGDGAIASYAPSLPEVLLGAGGLAVAFLITVVGVRALRFLPQDDLPAAPVAAPAGR